MIRLIVLLLLLPGVAQAEGRALVDLSIYALQQGGEIDPGGLLQARLEGKERLGPLTGEVNLLVLHAATSLPPDGREVERSSALAVTPRIDSGTVDRLVVDRAVVEARAGRASLIVGRQPVNLATCFFFMPNDLFAPFAATKYYRAYKPGVDAARLEWGAGDFTQITLLHVLGYTPDPTAPTGWTDIVDADRSSTIGRVSTLVADRVDVAILGGALGRDNLFGGALQGDLVAGFGFRAEGHYRWVDQGDNVAELALQLNRRFESSLDLTLEWFHHGVGAETVERYDPLAPLPAQRYAAVGAGYELTPLMTGQGSVIANLTDRSLLGSLYLVYSVADEADVDLSLSFPVGDPGGASQYGAAPTAVAASFRSYF